ncbi:MAG TPA: SurA N-terminal domain-containing protein [Chitinophagales bacterium]|nr:SurA N-terminal domain-containing protein [Chitinophagales bacterium]
MAVIGKIRQRSGLLIFLIGLSIVGFLIMDATNSQGSILKGRKDSVGEVNGEKISYVDFNKKYEDNLKSAEDQMRGQPIAEEQRNYIRTQTWTEMLNERIFSKVYEKLGINVTSEEMSELATGENASQYIKGDQQFMNPQTGQFDPSRVRLYLSSLDQPREGVEPGAVRAQWLKFEALLKQNQFQQKYNSLITKGLYVPTWMAEMTYNDQNRFVDFKYVLLPYAEVNEADVKVSDDDIKKYISEHAAKFKIDEETRKIQYVTFDVVPSGADTAATIKVLEEKRAEFAEGKNASDDSVFVKIYSETPFDEVYYDKDKLFSSVKDSFFSLPVKSIVGPYIDGNSARLAKISDRKMISDSVHVRELVISFAGVTSQDIANQKFALMDSIIRMVDTLKQDFGMFAAMYSDDQMGKMRGGDIGWVKQGEKEKYYNDMIFFRAQKGRIYRIPSQKENAFHLVQVVEDRPTKVGVQVSYFSKEIIPSPETERTIYGTATSFASDNQAEAKFREAAKKQNVKTVEQLKKDDWNIQGLPGNAREVVKWAFGAKKGEVSSIYTVDKKHVVALLDVVRAAGVPDVDAVRDQVKPEVIREKKYELLAKKINDAKASSIDDLAAKVGKPALDATHVSFASPAINNAYEPNVVGTALATATGKLSAAIKGNEGVFAVQPVNVQEPVKQTDYTSYTFQMAQQLQGKTRFANEVQKKLSKVKDDRSEFF